MSQNKPQWTEEQLAAIYEKGEILVSAGAGSGKTAVLIERILELITDPVCPVNINQLLVVTFTNAAAQEMRERMASALEKRLFNNESTNTEHIMRQIALLSQAQITTLHSFCLDLLRQYFYLINLDPGFRVADESEIQLLREDVLDRLFDKYYETFDPVFIQLVEGLGSDRDDRPLAEIILKIYDFAYSQINPKEWIMNLPEAYQITNVEELLSSLWGKAILFELNESLTMAQAYYEQALTLCADPAGPAHYLPVIEEELQLTIKLLNLLKDKKPWDEWEKALYEFSFSSLPRGKKRKDADPELEKAVKERVGAVRNKAKKIILTLKKNYAFPLKEQISALNEMKPLIKGLSRIVLDFADELAEEKKRKNIIDFTDMEHFALKLLQINNQPSPLAMNLKNRFVQVLVDEYQDINPVQERIIQLVSRTDCDDPNLFMVGDVKQSIYRFRMADPTLFLQKYNSFPHYFPYKKKSEKKQTVIDLTKNFRSRREVIEGVNFIFSQIMNPQTGELLYDEYAALKYGADYPEALHKINGGPIELHLIEKEPSKSEINGVNGEGFLQNVKSELPDSENDMDADDENSTDDTSDQLEARAVAQHILRLVNNPNHVVYDKKTQEYRPVQFKDIVILMRSYTSVAPVFAEEFKAMNIPVYSSTKQGYFASNEVETMIAFLQIIDNPHQDIPLATVLRSPIVGLNGTELGYIRALFPFGDYYEAMVLLIWAYMEKDECVSQDIREILDHYQEKLPDLFNDALKFLSDHPDLGNKLFKFWKMLNDLRTYSAQHSLSELIWRIYEDTGYLAYVGTLPGGEQRQANLQLLYDRACRFESTHYRGLFRFLRFLERFKEKQQDWGEAKTLGENENVVRFMTVHGSKGLEFPVVYVVGLGKPFNLRSVNETVLLHSKLGIGMPIIDIEKRIHYPSLIKRAVQRAVREESRAEEMRILYVALTRAKERLYLFGSVKNIEQSVQYWNDVAQNLQQEFLNYELCQSKTFLEWIGIALGRHPEKPLLNNGEEKGKSSQWLVFRHSSAICNFMEEKESSVQEKEVVGAEHLKEEIKRRLNWQYPYPLPNTFAKTSVSELKRQLRWYEEENLENSFIDFSDFSYPVPQFLQPQSLSPAEKGTAIHTILQHLPLEKWRGMWQAYSPDGQLNCIRAEIERMVDDQIVTPLQAESVNGLSIVQLLNSETGQKLFTAHEVRKEVPFTVHLKPIDQEPILVQGIIDVLMINSGKAEILDYKTDKINHTNGEKELIKKYSLQMAIYAYATELLLKMPVESCIIYSFALGRGIPIFRSHWQKELAEHFIIDTV